MNTQSDDGKGKPTQQQPGSDQQSQSGAQGNQQQQQEVASGEGKKYGEGSYSGTRQYNEGLKEHVDNHDIEKEARDAAPRSDAEEKDMEEAERIGRSRSRDDVEKPADDAEDERDLEK
jgi:hypothetical protein